MDQNTKIIVGVVIVGAALWYFNKADPVAAAEDGRRR